MIYHQAENERGQGRAPCNFPRSLYGDEAYKSAKVSFLRQINQHVGERKSPSRTVEWQFCENYARARNLERNCDMRNQEKKRLRCKFSCECR